MADTSYKKEPVDKWIIDPMKRFLNNSTMSGIVLFSSALIAILLSNSPWADDFHHFWEIRFSIGFHDWQLSKSLHHWINDGLMAVFFFVVGLELKREIISGELSNPRAALLPIVAAIGGMLVPALDLPHYQSIRRSFRRMGNSDGYRHCICTGYSLSAW